jgi:hypothetical protein
MPKHLRRTRTTSLSDDELTVLDVLFCGAFAPLRSLRRSTFKDQWNCPSHALDDEELTDTLNRFCEAGVLSSEQFLSEMRGQHPCFGLTAYGGALWEAERTPTWDRYATERYGGCDDSLGRYRVSICALSADIRDDFWMIGSEVGMWASDTGRARFAQIPKYHLIPWKDFPCTYVAVGKVRDCSLGCDWLLYDARRTWWRNVEELQRFL